MQPVGRHLIQLSNCPPTNLRIEIVSKLDYEREHGTRGWLPPDTLTNHVTNQAQVYRPTIYSISVYIHCTLGANLKKLFKILENKLKMKRFRLFIGPSGRVCSVVC